MTDGAFPLFEREGRVDGVGSGSCGPVDGNPASPPWGYITTTPKPGWAQTDFGREIKRRLGVPVAFDTDVNAAALGEHRWGAARDLDTSCYITVGTGIGGGGMVGGKLVHGCCTPGFDTCGSRPIGRGTRFQASGPTPGDAWEAWPSGRPSK